MTETEFLRRFVFLPDVWLLHSGLRLGGARWTFAGYRPFARFTSRGGRSILEVGRRRERRQGNPFAFLSRCMARWRRPGPDLPFPFRGGAIGWFAYEAGRFAEQMPRPGRRADGFPEIHLTFHDRFWVFDRRTGFARAVVVPVPGRPRPEPAELPPLLPAPAPTDASPRLTSDLTRTQYLARVRRIRRHIRRGDIYQANLTHGFTAQPVGDPGTHFLRLVKESPAPFSAFLRFGDRAVLSASPERFLRLRGRRAETRPIKGTRPRGATRAADRRLAQELLASEKDAAELSMIVDVERNDLGRVCEFGSVRVADHRRLESHPTVHHLVTTVRGALRPGRDAIDLLRAAFPGGSVTGAPKVRAMEILGELEPFRRSVYCGALGYINFDGDMDLNLPIRTILVEGDRARFQVGGGIVADSDPEAEYRESLDKGAALARSLGIVLP